MRPFKINFKLKEPQNIVPWGNSLHWFALTDGLLWINVGDQTIYEYTDEAVSFFGRNIKYNDYQLSRFLEDFSQILPFVAEPVPHVLYDYAEIFAEKADKWKQQHINLCDEEFEKFYDDQYEPLYEWFTERSIDSGHLIEGPIISCIRCDDKLKIIWKSYHNEKYGLDSGNSLWTAPFGCFEIGYDAFVSEIDSFFERFVFAMDEQVSKASCIDGHDIRLDKSKLFKEHELRKNSLRWAVNELRNQQISTDWNKISELYKKMMEELSSYNT